jgi:hypothetical protein
MDERTAHEIADEVLYVLYGCKVDFPGAYEYFMGKMDMADDVLEEAAKVIFPGAF